MLKGKVSVPVWALGSFLPVRIDLPPHHSVCFSARVGSGVFSTSAKEAADDIRRWWPTSFSARVGSGVFSTVTIFNATPHVIRFVSVPVWALGSFLRKGCNGEAEKPYRVSVPVWALGSFLRG